MKMKTLIPESMQSYTLTINVGDVIYMGKFKNKKVTVKSISVDEYNQPVINGKKLLTGRIEKLYETE